MTETVIQMEKTTGELMDILRSKPDAAAFVQENADELQNKTVPELLADLMERKQLTRAAVIRAAGHAVLYPRNARDVVIIECLYQRCGIIACNTKLGAQNQPLLE